MMKRDLTRELDARLAGGPAAAPWLDALIEGVRGNVPAPTAWSPALVAEVAAVAAAGPVLQVTVRRRRMRVLRRSLVLNAAVLLILLVGSAALAVSTTRSGSAPAPIRAIVDQLAEWTGFEQVSPTTTTTTATTTTQPGFVPPGLSEDPPGNRGEGTGPPDNSNSGGVDVPPGQSDDPPGNRGASTGPPATSNAGGNGAEKAQGNGKKP